MNRFFDINSELAQQIVDSVKSVVSFDINFIEDVYKRQLHDSELPLMKDFPVMIYNLADYFLPSRSGTTGIYCGQKLNTAYSAAAEKITVTNTEGEERLSLIHIS